MFAQHEFRGFTPLGGMLPAMFNKARRMSVDLKNSWSLSTRRAQGTRKSHLRAALARKYRATPLSILRNTTIRSKTVVSRKRCRQLIVVRTSASYYCVGTLGRSNSVRSLRGNNTSRSRVQETVIMGIIAWRRRGQGQCCK
jgi:hypothetical protein